MIVTVISLIHLNKLQFVKLNRERIKTIS